MFFFAGNIERKIRRYKTVEDYNKLKYVIEKARNGANRILVQDVKIFQRWPNGRKIGSLPVEVARYCARKVCKRVAKFIFQIKFRREGIPGGYFPSKIVPTGDSKCRECT